MLEERKTLRLWRRRRPNYLSIERGLATEQSAGRLTKSENRVIGQKAILRRAIHSKRGAGTA